MTRPAPAPTVLADQLEAAARLLRTSGPDAIRLAEVLAARGWPSRHSEPADPDRDPEEVPEEERGVTFTALEASAIRPGPWADADTDLNAIMRRTWGDIGLLSHLIRRTVAHADPASAEERTHRRAGSGACQACSRHVAGSATDRLRAGFCDACRKAWERDGRPDRAAWCHRRAELLQSVTPAHVDPTVAGSLS